MSEVPLQCVKDVPEMGVAEDGEGCAPSSQKPAPLSPIWCARPYSTPKLTDPYPQSLRVNFSIQGNFAHEKNAHPP